MEQAAADHAAAKQPYQQAIDGKAKPPGSLGRLEEWAVRLAALQGTQQPAIDGAFLLLFAADHGITAEVPGVSAYPRQVTPAMFHAIARGQAASSVLCAANDCQLLLVDVGVDGVLTSSSSSSSSSTSNEGAAAPGRHVHHRKVCRGTSSFLSSPAMMPEQCTAAMQVGQEAVAYACGHFAGAGKNSSTTSRGSTDAASSGGSQQCSGGQVDSGPELHRVALCVGELGIGNTTAAAALLAALTGEPPESVCGRGTGLDDAGVSLKVKVVTEALQANAALIQQGPLSALAAVGGLELAAMTGAYLEASRRQLPVIVDGFISGVAALAAVRADPAVSRCLFASHTSEERGAQLLLKELGCEPVLDMKLRLGEGTGALLALPVLRSAAAVMRDMASLSEVLAAAAGDKQADTQPGCS